MMIETISKMDLSEIGIALLFALAGFVSGYAIAAFRRYMKDRKFMKEESRIKKQVAKMSLDKIRELSENGNLKIDPAVKTLLQKVDAALGNIEVYKRDRSEIEDDIEDLRGFLEQLANA